MIEKLDKWLLGVDYTTTSWNDYRYFGESDMVKNSWMLKVGGQITPNLYNAKSYWGRVTYRPGLILVPITFLLVVSCPSLDFHLAPVFPLEETHTPISSPISTWALNSAKGGTTIT
jgi:hypothetical protein